MSRLRGLSKFEESNAALGLSTLELDNILDTSNCLHLFAHHILIAAGNELRLFQAFLAWLTREVGVQSQGSMSASAQEAVEKDFDIDYDSTLAYIEGAMIQSKLLNLFNMHTRQVGEPYWDLEAEGRSLYELYRRELKLVDTEASSVKRLPGLDALVAHIDKQCNLVFRPKEACKIWSSNKFRGRSVNLLRPKNATRSVKIPWLSLKQNLTKIRTQRILICSPYMLLSAPTPKRKTVRFCSLGSS